MLVRRKKPKSRKRPLTKKQDVWTQLRGSAKDIFAELGGGEAYLRGERSNFYSSKTSEKDCGG